MESRISKNEGQAPSDAVWGAEAIGSVIGLAPRQVFHLLDKGLLPAKKLGGKWVARRSELLAFLSSGEVA